MEKLKKIYGMSHQELDAMWDLFVSMSQSLVFIEENLPQMRIMAHMLDLDSEDFREYTGQNLYSEEEIAEETDLYGFPIYNFHQ